MRNFGFTSHEKSFVGFRGDDVDDENIAVVAAMMFVGA